MSLSAAWQTDCRCLVWSQDNRLGHAFTGQVRNDGTSAGGECPHGEEWTEAKHIFKIKDEKEASKLSNQRLRGS